MGICRRIVIFSTRSPAAKDVHWTLQLPSRSPCPRQLSDLFNTCMFAPFARGSAATGHTSRFSPSLPPGHASSSSQHRPQSLAPPDCAYTNHPGLVSIVEWRCQLYDEPGMVAMRVRDSRGGVRPMGGNAGWPQEYIKSCGMAGLDTHTHSKESGIPSCNRTIISEVS